VDTLYGHQAGVLAVDLLRQARRAPRALGSRALVHEVFPLQAAARRSAARLAACRPLLAPTGEPRRGAVRMPILAGRRRWAPASAAVVAQSSASRQGCVSRGTPCLCTPAQ